MKLLVYLLILLTPFIFGYLLFLFVSWGAYPNPGSWDEDNRLGLVVIFVIWGICMLPILFP